MPAANAAPIFARMDGSSLLSHLLSPCVSLHVHLAENRVFGLLLHLDFQHHISLELNNFFSDKYLFTVFHVVFVASTGLPELSISSGIGQGPGLDVLLEKRFGGVTTFNAGGLPNPAPINVFFPEKS